MIATHSLPPSRAGTLDLVAGALALDFCNTSSGRGGPQHQEHLREDGDVLRWAAHAGLKVPTSGVVLGRALVLREAVYCIMAARAQGAAPEPAGLDALAAEHAACLAQARLAPAGDAYAWVWDAESAPVAAVLGPIALSAVALLMQAPARLKQCQGRHCGWLFLDGTKNRSRLWCEMGVCGNRAKQRRRRGASA